MQEFQLRIVPLKDNHFIIQLYQWDYKKAGEKKRLSPQKVGVLKMNKIILVRDAIYQTLKDNKYDPKTLNNKRKSNYILTESSGINLAILFKTIQPLRKEEKIISIMNSIMAMSHEEAYYWFAKISGDRGNLALRALRILLAD
ncbi:hypothetical protein IQ215_01575 [Cyanobacterium stanieri LEGE 03274]|uniref:DUF7680 domain-containing protein n=1 Tax=Cyanobacterium stanieri LEGE 03274 TaxID=1828756 RepID=A0ABR9V2P4_9CHRO|nr:hypothetical protein [Cyanobacterium stanieri]MBE9221376.1 hypothetical protein [Cyanobacterium stanieri LEGE 03274]